MKEKIFDVPVAVTKTAAMRYIAEAAGHGYHLFQTGVVPAKKVLPLIEKFDRQYRVLATRGMRDNDRSRGRSCARLILFPKDCYPVERPDREWLFWLMATDGAGTLADEKCTREARAPSTRLPWLTQYELVSRPVRRRNGDLDHVWTWVLQDAFMARWRHALHKAAGRVRSSRERKPDYLIKLLTSLRRVPGFQGINRQKKALIISADIPRTWHEKLNLKLLGTVVNKSLAVFSPERTVASMLQIAESSIKHDVAPEIALFDTVGTGQVYAVSVALDLGQHEAECDRTHD